MTYYLPIPKDNPESVLTALGPEERQIVSFEMALARGQSDGVRDFYDVFFKSSRYFLTVAGTSVVGAVMQGDKDLFDRIYADIFRFGDIYNHPCAKLGAQLMDCWVRQYLRVDEGYPDWLVNMDFGAVPLEWRQQAVFIAAHVLLVRKDFEKAYAIARMLLALYDGGPLVSSVSIRMRLVAAIACRELNRLDEMTSLYEEIAGLVGPKAYVNQLVGYTIGPSTPLERALRNHPEFLDKLRVYSEIHYRNLIVLHNHFTGKRRATNLTVREFFLARQLKMGKTYKELAQYLDVSPGRLHNIVIQLYGKLNVHSREELDPIVW